MNFRILFTIAGLALSAGYGATITLGNNPQPNENNVLLNSGISGLTTVTGTLNAFPGVNVNFTSNVALTEPANGQARIEAASGQPLTTMSVSLGAGLTYGDLIFNPAVIGNPSGGGGTATVSLALVNMTTGTPSTFSQTFTFGNGNNFVTVLAGANEGIIATTVNVPNGFASFQQPRISGPFVVSGGGGTAGDQAPEPGTYALLGGGLVLIAVRRLRSKQA